MMFDLSQDIPAGSIIEAVTLSMYVSKVPPGPTNQAFNLHLMTGDWGEGTSDAGSPGGAGAVATVGDATWTHAFHPTQEWNFPGGDFNFSHSASTSILNPGTYTWSDPLMITDVQGWVDDPSTNFGWAVLGPNVDKTARRFNSREHSNAELRPKLTITYTPGATHWANYPILEDGRTVNTGDYLGWIDIETKPWVYVYNLGNWIYLPESHVTEVGAWTYIPK